MKEEEITPQGSENAESTHPSTAELDALKEKVNVDQAAIDEAREAAGDDAEKIKEYLINNRGL